VVRAEAPAGLRLRPLSSHPYSVVDVFTSTPLAGNALAVIHDADGLDEETMLRVARETRLSETTFVQTATVEGADYRNRIFTMLGEIPFAGHPSLGTAFAVALARGASSVRYLQQTGAGLQQIDVELDGVRGSASMLQEPADFGVQVDPAVALAPVGLTAGDAHPDGPPQVISTGVSQLIVVLRDPEALSRLAIDWSALDAVLDEYGVVVMYLAWVDPTTREARARSFMHSTEGGEDPASGSAAGPLCALVAARKGIDRIVVSQGVEMGRPSRL
jgi:trans-2,3-dihydro-3-hydroxyanthranilate isomerase